MINDELKAKYEKLKEYIKEQGSAAVAFSSGVDSSFLLKVAQQVLKDKVIAITATSFSFPERELKEAVDFCKENNIKHFTIDLNQSEIEGFCQNHENRCYLCKKELFRRIRNVAEENNIKNILEGSNTDDNNDFRPGMVAVKEMGIKSPLMLIGLSKEEIRVLSAEMNLPTSNKPSFACLATRFVYGETITKEKLEMVDKAEQLLHDLGFYQVRVRLHKDIARIEVIPDEFEKVLINREVITDRFKSFGFKYITMDLQGYRTGSMNEASDLNVGKI